MGEMEYARLVCSGGDVPCTQEFRMWNHKKIFLDLNRFRHPPKNENRKQETSRRKHQSHREQERKNNTDWIFDFISLCSSIVARKPPQELSCVFHCVSQNRKLGTMTTMNHSTIVVPQNETAPILETGFSLSEQAHELVATTPAVVEEETTTTGKTTPSNTQELRESVVRDMMGFDTVVNSPLEWKAGKSVKVPLVYCDFTASHRPLSSLEDYLHKTCIPYYGNTHTNTSITGSQSTAFCSEARQIIGEACGAKTTGKASQDVVLFA